MSEMSWVTYRSGAVGQHEMHCESGARDDAHLEDTVSSGALGVNDTLGNALAIKVGEAVVEGARSGRPLRNMYEELELTHR